MKVVCITSAAAVASTAMPMSTAARQPVAHGRFTVLVLHHMLATLQQQAPGEELAMQVRLF